MNVLAYGGHLGPGDPRDAFLLELAGKEQPRILCVPTASGDSDLTIVRFYEAFRDRARPAHLKLFGIPPRDLRGLVLAHDVVWVGGGNTANMLAVWRLHGLDRILREAWEGGVVLGGVSAGSICWFAAGVTDSFREELDGMECLGFLPGSNCPHYDGEETRRPAFHRLVAAGFPAGIAADDGCALHFRGRDLVEAVAAVPGARAYRVEPDGGGGARELPVEARLLG